MGEEFRRSTVDMERIEAVSGFARTVVHDFGNQLAIIDWSAQLLAGAADAAPGVERYAANIVEASRRVARYIDRLAILGQIQEMQPRPMPMLAALRDLEEFLEKRTPPVSLSFEAMAQDVTILCTGEALAQLILELLDNAAQAVGDDGVIEIGVSVEPEIVVPSEREILKSDGTLELWSGALPTRGRRYARLTVSDNGGGMELQTMSKAVEPFFTTKAKGSLLGLGLSIVHAIVCRCGAALVLKSGPKMGLTAGVLFPIV